MKPHQGFAIAALAVFVLAGCGDKKGASESNFTQAISENLERNSDLCLSRQKGAMEPDIMGQWPYTVTEQILVGEARDPAGLTAKMRALEAAGLVRSEAALTPEGEKAKLFSLTDAAKPYVKEVEVARGSGPKVKELDLCWGKMALNEVKNWKVMEVRGLKVAAITYTYKIDKLADWVNRPDIQAAFPKIAVELEKAGKDRSMSAELTEQGWKTSLR